MLRVHRELRLRLALAMPAMLVSLAAFAQAPSSKSAAPELAQEEHPGLDLSVVVGATQSDNLARVADDEESGSIGRAGVLMDYLQKSRRIEADVNVNAMYEKYARDTFDDDLAGGADASLTVGIVPERFLWQFQENFGQITPDPFAAPTPDNREDINYFTTGPDITMRLGSAMSLQFSGRYSDTSYEVSNLNGQQYGGGITLTRELSGVSTVALVADTQHFDFDDNAANSDYDTHEGFLRYQALGSRTEMTVDAGYTWLEKTGEDSSDGALLRVSFERRVSASTHLTLGFGTQFSNSSDQFRGDQQQSGVSRNPASVQASGDPFELRFARLSYDFQRNRTDIGLSADYHTESYEVDQSLDRDVLSWNFFLSRHLSSALELRIFADAEHQEFDNIDFDSDDLSAGAYLSWAVGRQVSLRLQYDRMKRDSNNRVSDYTENQASLFLLWSPIQRP